MILKLNSKLPQCFCFFAKCNFCIHILQFLLLIYEGDRCRKKKRLNFQACLFVYATYSCHNQLFPHILSIKHICLKCRLIYDLTIEPPQRQQNQHDLQKFGEKCLLFLWDELSDNSKNSYRNRRNNFHVLRVFPFLWLTWTVLYDYLWNV